MRRIRPSRKPSTSPPSTRRSRLTRLLVVAGLIAGPIVTAAAPASAAPRWSVIPSPSPPGPPLGDLGSVSCSSPTNCFAVGGGPSDSGASGGTLIERSDGTGWTTVTSPSPIGANVVELNGIACPTDTTCFAVGDSAKESATTFAVKALIEKWDGSKWSIVASPVPKGTTDVQIIAVSCSSASDCFAVGDYSTTSISTPLFSLEPLVEHWNGTRWSIVTVPSPAGTLEATLNGVSCPSATSCFAVGDYASRSTAGTLTERWNGAVWSIVATPVTNGSVTNGSVTSSARPNLISNFGTSPGLGDVSCTSETNCFAVGNAFGRTLVEQWDGASWTIVGSQSPHGAASSELNAVSCAGPTDCSAVGDSFTPPGSGGLGGSQDAVAEHFDGTSWTIAAQPVDSPFTVLADVSCPASTSCVAVGDSALAERWNGTSWSMMAFGAKTSQSDLVQVSCPSPTSCFAVGSYGTSSTSKSLIEHWNGRSWAITASSAPSGASDTRLNGVSCVSSTNCFAVGAYSTDTAEKSLIEHWNGKTWSIVASPSPGGAEVTDLIGVSCPGAKNCTAVGIALGRKAGETLVEHWNGKRWSVVTTPNPQGALLIELIGVSCPSPADCTAVGAYDAITGRSLSVTPLVEHWNGKSWSIVANPPTSGAVFASLTAVSCPSTTNCTAVGSQESTAGFSTKSLVEHWNGKSWSIVASANPKGATQVSLSDVACRSTSSCYAVGRYSTPSAGKTLVEHWNGAAWTIVASANPAHATNAILASVSCPSPTRCIAVGSFDANNGFFTLTEHGR
jgi:hypothetical protein